LAEVKETESWEIRVMTRLKDPSVDNTRSNSQSFTNIFEQFLEYEFGNKEVKEM